MRKSNFSRLVVAGLVALALSACSAGSGSENTGSGNGASSGIDAPSTSPHIAVGAIDLAVTETCLLTEDTKCVSVDGQGVIPPKGFERADVAEAAAATSPGPGAIDVTLTSDGAKTLSSLTKRALEAGDTARLILRYGGEIRSAVSVMESIDTGEFQLGLAPDADPEQTVASLMTGPEPTPPESTASAG